jgi:hypothetical protein
MSEMKCQEFQERLGEVASERGREAGLRQRAEAHAARCQPCAARWQAQLALNERLREFAAATSLLPAPHVRQHLHAALAAQRQPVAGLRSAPVVDLAAVRGARWRLSTAPRGAWLAAAAGLALLALTTMFWQRFGSSVERTHTEEFTVVAPAPLLPPAPPVAPPLTARLPVDQVVPAKTPVRHLARRARGLELALAQEETSSDFVPLTLAVDERALENRTLVRLAVPRARLVALGLPLPVHGDREMVNAEVMLGDNGVAYAIRLVR